MTNIVLEIRDFLYGKSVQPVQQSACQTSPPLPATVPSIACSPTPQPPLPSTVSFNLPPPSSPTPQPSPFNPAPQPPPSSTSPFNPALQPPPSLTSPFSSAPQPLSMASSNPAPPSPQPQPSSTVSFNPAIPSPVVPSCAPPFPLSGQHLAGLVNEVHLQSCSRNNFCANMVRRLYTVEERKSSNVKGKFGKRQLDPTRLAVVHQYALETYPLGTGEKDEVIWRQCIKAIDEVCRRLNRYQKSDSQNLV